MVKELKSFRLSIWGKWLGYLAGIFMFFGLFKFGNVGFFQWFICLLLELITIALLYLPCCNCFKAIKPINEKLAAARTPLIIGIVLIVTGIFFWSQSIVGAIISLISGVFYVLGSFFDKKDASSAPMV